MITYPVSRRGSGCQRAASTAETAIASAPPVLSRYAASSAAWKLVPVPTMMNRSAARNACACAVTSMLATCSSVSGCVWIMRCNSVVMLWAPWGRCGSRFAGEADDVLGEGSERAEVVAAADRFHVETELVALLDDLVHAVDPVVGGGTSSCTPDFCPGPLDPACRRVARFLVQVDRGAGVVIITDDIVAGFDGEGLAGLAEKPVAGHHVDEPGGRGGGDAG